MKNKYLEINSVRTAYLECPPALCMPGREVCLESEWEEKWGLSQLWLNTFAGAAWVAQPFNPAFSPGPDPGNPGSSPMSGSLQWSLLLPLPVSLPLSLSSLCFS